MKIIKYDDNVVAFVLNWYSLEFEEDLVIYWLKYVTISVEFSSFFSLELRNLLNRWTWVFLILTLTELYKW